MRDIERARRDGAPLRWYRTAITLYVHEPAPGAGFSSPELAAAVTSAAAAWTRTCALDVVVRSTSAEPKSARDGVNSVIVRTRSWCPDGVSVKSECHDEQLHALTRLYKSPPPDGSTDARIDEADIEINAVHHRWTLGRSDEREHRDSKNLEATLVHEVGHMLGFDHPRAAAPRGTLPDHAMYPDPQGSGRPLVFEPSDGEIATLCAIYGSRKSTLASPTLLLAATCLASLGLAIALFRRWPLPRARA